MKKLWQVKTVILFFVVLFLPLGLLHAQAPECQWVNEITGTTNHQIHSCKSDANNNLFSSGFGRSTFNYDCFFNPETVSLPSPDQLDLILTKTSPLGNLIWANNISYEGPSGSFIATFGGKLEYDGLSNLYVADIFTSTAIVHGGNFQDSILTALPGSDSRSILCAKYDTSGNPIWVRQLDATTGLIINNTAISPNGTFAICGYFTNVFVLEDSTYISQGFEDGFIAEFSSEGDPISFHVFGTPVADYCTDVSYDSNGNLYASVITASQTIDADPGEAIYELIHTPSSPSYFSIVLKLNSNGDLIWAKKYDSQSGYTVSSVQVDDSDKLLIAGQFEGNMDVDFNENSVFTISCNTPNISVNHFVSKNDLNGDFIWAKHVPANTFGVGGGVMETDHLNNVYIGGLSVACDFNPGAAIDSISGFPDFTSYLWSLDAQGGHRWVKQIIKPINQLSAPTSFSGITIPPNSDIIYGVGCAYTESTFSTASPDYTIYSNVFGSSCGFMVKYGNCPLVIEKETVTHCDSTYVWNGQEYTESGSYFELFQTEFGCDSVSSLELQLGQAVSAELIIESCEPLVINNQTFNESGVYNQSLVSSYGCDSLLSILYTKLAASSSSLEINTCTPVTINTTTYTESGNYNQILSNSIGCDSVLSINVNFEEPTAAIYTNDSSVYAVGNFETIKWLSCSGNSLIEGADSSVFNPSDAGQFAAIITLNGCLDTTFCKSFEPSVFTCNSLFISPNPAKEFITFQYPESAYLIQIFATNGALIRSQTGNESTQKIDVSYLASGVYVIQIGSCRVKFVKER